LKKKVPLGHGEIEKTSRKKNKQCRGGGNTQGRCSGIEPLWVVAVEKKK